MKLPRWQPREQISDRRHYDPPALWYAVILGSIALHLSAFGMMQLLGIGGLIGRNSEKTLIPIDVVAIAPTTRSTPKTTSTPAQKPINKSNQTPRQTAPTSSTKSVKKQPISKNTKKSATVNSSKSSVKVQPKTQPTPTSKNNPTSTITPNPAPSSSKPSPSPGSGGGLIAFPGKLVLISTTDILHPGDPNYNDELATLLDSNKKLSTEELKQIGVNLKEDLELKVGIIVETDGTASVLPAQVVVVRGSISQDQAFALARKIIPQWRFKPTKMAGSKVLGNYSLPLTIRRASK